MHLECAGGGAGYVECGTRGTARSLESQLKGPKGPKICPGRRSGKVQPAVGATVIQFSVIVTRYVQTPRNYGPLSHIGDLESTEFAGGDGNGANGLGGRIGRFHCTQSDLWDVDITIGRFKPDMKTSMYSTCSYRMPLKEAHRWSFSSAGCGC